MIDRKGATAPVLALLLASCYIGNTNAFSLTNSRSSVSVGNVGVGTCPSSKAVSASAASSSPLGALRSMSFVINNAQRSISSTLLMATATEGGEYPAASDGEALQSLFAKNCDGLMAEAELTSVPAIKEMLVRLISYCYIIVYCCFVWYYMHIPAMSWVCCMCSFEGRETGWLLLLLFCDNDNPNIITCTLINH